jgi:hypothetical protein
MIRRARGRDTTLFLRREVIPARGGWPCGLSVNWAPHRWPRRPLEARQVGEVTVVMDRRVARYTQWRDVRISAWRLGPLERVVVVDERLVLLEMEAWERTHPAATHPSAA